MTDLPKRLEAAGRREAEKYSKWYSGHINHVFDFEKGHSHLHPLILKVAEALEEIGNKEWVQGSSVKKICTETLAELEKYLEGKK